MHKDNGTHAVNQDNPHMCMTRNSAVNIVFYVLPSLWLIVQIAKYAADYCDQTQY